MILVSGLQGMKMIRNEITGLIRITVIIALLLIGAPIRADEGEGQGSEKMTKEKVSSGQSTAQIKEARDKESTTFTPTEEVSADQAVAFPTDI